VPGESELEEWGLLKDWLRGVELYRAAGCEACGGTGYAGQTGFFELLVVDEALRDRIRARASADELRETARAGGLFTLLEEGGQKVLDGVTSREEVKRVLPAQEARERER
jgi:type II secretory ATPase GspE/PulE/Tfp pilus assembly ATPase PilB-like protein